MNYIKTIALLLVLTMILVWIGGLVGGPRGAMYAFIFALLLNGVSYWYSDKIVLAMCRAKEVPQDKFFHLYDLVEELTQSANLPMPKIYMTENRSPNAFATGRSPEKAVVCVTRGILELLDESELKGVLAHELAHVKNRDTLIMTVTASVAGAIMMLAYMARWAFILGGASRGRRDGANAISLLAVSIIAPLAAVIVQLAISRSREYEADRHGAYFAKNPEGLARALESLDRAVKVRPMQSTMPQTEHLFIVHPFRSGFVANLFSTHPPIQERVRRLRRMK